MTWLSRLRHRLAALILLVLIPLAAYVSWTGYERHDAARRATVREAEGLAETVLEAEADAVRSAKLLLDVLAEARAIQEPDPAGCHALLSRIQADQPRYAALGVFDARGDTICAGVPLPGPVNVADRSYFRRAVETRAFAIGDYQVGLVSGRPSLGFARPVIAPDQSVRAVVYAALDLGWFSETLGNASLPPGSVLVMMDRNGTVIARVPDPEAFIGRTFADAPLFKAMQAQPSGGSVEVEGLDGTPRLFKFFRMGPDADDTSIHAAVGLPLGTLLGGIDRDLYRELAILAVAGLVLAAGAFWSGERLISRPIRRLAALSREIGAGDLRARSGLDYRAGELGALAASMDRMAEALAAAEAGRWESQALLRAVIDAIPATINVKDLDHRYVLVNAYQAALHGRPVEWFAGRSPEDLFPETHARTLRERHRAVVESGRPSGPAEYDYAEPDGRITTWLTSRVPLRDASGKVTHVLSVGIDITDRKRAEEALRESERRSRHLIESAHAVPYTWDVAARRYTYVGPQVTALLGYPPEQWTDEESWLARMHPDDRERVRAHSREFNAAPRDERAEYRILRPDGRVVWVQDIIRIEPGEGGRLTGYGIVIDITEDKQREAQLQQALRMEAVGQLTSGLAHDFNNLLAVVIGNIDLLLMELEGREPEARKLARSALTAGLRGAELTKQLLAFARRQSLRPVAVDLNETVTRAVAFLGRTLGESIEIRTVLAPDLWPLEVDPAQLESALANLAINARDAMPEGGRLTLETANRRIDESYAAQNVDVAPGDYVVLSVTDTGVGMPPEVAARAFEPFFTTKEVGKGSGLGLSMVYGFMKQSKGHASIYSEPGHGTTVRLFFPRAAGAPRAAPPPGDSRPARSDGELILVVEDNPMVRSSVVDQLHALGYRTLEAETGHEALALLERQPGIDLLFSDVVMPGGMSGRDLAAAARQLRPGIKVVLTSGFTDAELRGEDREHFLGKPYRWQDLAAKLRAVLEEGRP